MQKPMDTILIQELIKEATINICRKIDCAQRAADVKLSTLNIKIISYPSQDGRKTVAHATAKMTMNIYSSVSDREITKI